MFVRIWKKRRAIQGVIDGRVTIVWRDATNEMTDTCHKEIGQERISSELARSEHEFQQR